ncbi:MAG: hypothetical protein LC126_04430 [Bryobacterales bacterium]|nr:hypothetical protein [Bryobacterales bacterium]
MLNAEAPASQSETGILQARAAGEQNTPRARIADAAGPRTRAVNVRAEAPNPGGLPLPGKFRRITFPHVLQWAPPHRLRPAG